jgi:hypothetical protein
MDAHDGLYAEAGCLPGNWSYLRLGVVPLGGFDPMRPMQFCRARLRQLFALGQ